MEFESIPGIADVELLGAGPTRLLIEVPHGADKRAHYDAVRARLVGDLPKDLHVFFHTNAEPSPWIEFDLGRVRPVRYVRVVNRSDCCGDRAVPLHLELSTDHRRWTHIAQRAYAFEDWSQRFTPTPARWVRVRSTRGDYLHLERVEIR